MHVQADTAFLVTLMLVSIRIGAVLLLTPLFAVGDVPVRIRVIIALGLSLLLVTALPIDATRAPLSVGALAEAALLELVTGGLLAFGVTAAFAAFLFGGRILDFQLGFGVAGLIDPTTRTESPLMGSLLQMMAVTTFFLVNGHHLLIRGLAASLERIPPGLPGAGAGSAPIVAQFGVMFAYGFAVVAPAVLTLLLVDVGMAIAARTMPQVNMFILGIPIKVLVGLSVLVVSLRTMGPLLERTFTTIFTYWDAVIR